MKNKFVRVVSLVVCIAVIFGCAAALGSCNFLEKVPSADDILELDSEQRAYELFAYADRMMSKADSYTARMLYNMSLTVGDYEIVAEGVEESIVSGMRSEAFSEYSEGTSKVSISSDTSAVSEMQTVMGYKDGMYFRKYVTDSKLQALCSEMTRTEYNDHKKYLGGIEFDFSDDSCVTTTCTYNEDGTWVATYTDFFEEELTQYEKLTEELALLFPEGVKLADIAVEVKVDELFYVESVSVDYVYTGKGVELPSFNITVNYSDYNDTEAADVDLDEYTEVDDIRVIDKIDDALKAVTDKTNVSFTTQYNQKITVAGESDIIKQKFEGTFENGAGFSFDVTFTADDGSQLIITYSGGKQIVYEVVVDEETGDVLHNELAVYDSYDAEAKSFIDDICDIDLFNSIDICDVEQKNSSKTYILTVDYPDTESYDYILEYAEAEEWAVSTATYTVELEGGKIKTFTYDLTLNTAYDDSGIGVRLRSVTEFK